MAERTTARPRKLAEVIALALVDEIRANGLSEGDTLPHEKQMVDDLGVGRATVREALRLLESRGLVRIRPGAGGGPVVRRPEAKDLAEPLALWLTFAGTSLRDLIEARLCVEPVTAGNAAPHASPQHVAALRRSVARMRSNADDLDVFAAENVAFHTQIAMLGRNSVLQAFVDSVKHIFDGMTVGVSYSPHKRLATADAHDRIVDAIQARDSAAAEAEMRLHLEEARKFWRRRFGKLYDGPLNWLERH